MYAGLNDFILSADNITDNKSTEITAKNVKPLSIILILHVIGV